jgi:hypothetical protein
LKEGIYVANTKNKKANTLEPFCVCCGSTKSSDFYMSKSKLFAATGKLLVCKQCIDNLFNDYFALYGENKKAMYFLCRRLDVPFSIAAFNGATNHSINNYGDCFDQSDDFLDDENTENNNINLEKEDLYISDELVRKWGNLPQQDIIFLEEQYREWCTRYDVSTKAMELLVQEICYQQLNIKKNRERGNNVSKELKDLQDLMNSAALKPIQESAAMAADVNTLGTWIKKFENEKPIPEPDPEFQDVDDIKKYIRVWFLGHFCRMLGINNVYAKEYEEELRKYSVEITEEDLQKNNISDDVYDNVKSDNMEVGGQDDMVQ